MRKFNKNEQLFFNNLNRYSNEDPHTFVHFLKIKYFNDFHTPSLIINNTTKTVFFYTKKGTTLEQRNKLLSKFYEILFLCVHLKENRYINIIPNNITPTVEYVNNEFSSTSYSNLKPKQILNDQGDYYDNSTRNIYNNNQSLIFEHIKLHEETYNLIHENLNGVLFVSEDLKEYVKNNFKTKEERNFIFAQTMVVIGIISAIIIGVYGLIKPNNELIQINNELKKIHYDIHLLEEKNYLQ
jgi:hypothetical protein